MRKIIVSEFLTLDGVMEASEQWQPPYVSNDVAEEIRSEIHAAEGSLLGRVTYEIFAAFWPLQTHNEFGIADKLNSEKKFVVSSTLEKAEWNNSTLIKGNVAEEIRKKQYLFGTEVTTDWKVGSPITYKGTWEGKAYEDKGRVLQIEPGKLLVSTFWSSLSGLPDIPENYQTVRYELSAKGAGTYLTITQDNNASQEEAKHSEQNWKMVLEGMKTLLEA